MKTIIWKLKNGDRVGQETADQKRMEGYNYIERLAQEENVVNVIDDGKQLNIYIEE